MRTYGSLFSGIGGFDLALNRAGWSCSWQCEIDKAALSVLASQFPGVKNIGDVRNVRRDTVEPVDLICGGFPCQDLSVAGKRAGLVGERSGLWYEFARVIEELKPGWVLIENVPGLLSSNGGRDMETILRSLVEFGYGVAWRVLDAQYFGLAQRRKRVFIVGHLGDGRAAEVLFERESGPGDTPPSREKGERVAGSLDRKSASSNRGSQANESEFIVIQTANSGANQNNIKRTDVMDTIDSWSSLAIFDTTQITSWANYSNPKIGDPCHPLANRMNPPLISFIPGQSSAARSLGESYDLSVTVKGEGGGTKPCIAYDRRSKYEIDKTPTLHAGGGGSQSPFVGVRRLTPTECERLQGFPDGWTAGQSDSARYRQLGNAVAVPVVEWIARRIP